MYKNILVPLDGSELAECTLQHVKNLVKSGLAEEVTLINVFIVPIPTSRRGQYTELENINEFRKNLRMGSENYLADVESRLAAEGIKVKKASLEGNAIADTIADYAQKHGMDLIVIATHGYTGLKKLMFGSVALAVLHESRIPVLLIRPESCLSRGDKHSAEQ